MNILGHLPVWAFLLIATTLEVTGDAVIRIAIYNHAGVTRIGFMLAGAALLLGYGLALNLAPVEFGRVVGLSFALWFFVGHLINLFFSERCRACPFWLGARSLSPAV